MERILYTPVGVTDPVRGGRDGAMLHIVREYCPYKVYVFLTDEMLPNMEKYRIGIRHVCPTSEIEFIDWHQIDEPQKLDLLTPMMDEFLRIRKENPDAEILLNLSSGTPQMKTVMTFLATDFENVRGIQVNSPEKASNKRNFPVQDDEDFFNIIGEDYDDFADHENRCFEPKLKLLQRYSVKHELEQLISNYEYRAAYYLYKVNKSMFSKEVGKLINHAMKRSALCYKEAFNSYDICEYDKSCKYWEEIAKLNEFLMIMELRRNREEISEFIVKITPFLFELLHFYMEKKLNINMANICDKQSDKEVVNLAKLKKNHPDMYDAFISKIKDPRPNSSLSFYFMSIMVSGIQGTDEIVALCKQLREVETGYRHMLAHKILVNVNENSLKTKGPKLVSADIMKLLWKLFIVVMQGEKIYTSNVYDELNDKIIANLDTVNL